ncbi:MAG: NAD+ synthase [Chloroflexi bacterium RBG_16_64_32]|nr:MAG: NAD+ synthase [Chloroflexi bacterium RBG_16_64_32]
MRKLRVGLAQINTTVGDLEGNVAKVLDYVERAREMGVDIVSFPELTVTGYPPEDLLLRPSFVRDNRQALEAVVNGCGGITAVVGFVDLDGGIYNAAAVIHDGRLADVYHKQKLPNYGVFDEVRYFRPGDSYPVYTVAGVSVGVNVCEDIWYPGDPTQAQARAGAQVIININGSPYHAGKRDLRQEMLATRARDYGVFLCYANQVGGQDELVFDGGSMVLGPDGGLVAQAAMFEEELLVCDLSIGEAKEAKRPRRVRGVALSDEPFVSDKPPVEPRVATPLEREAEVYAALVTGTRDYLRKTGFQKVVIALSGGIDSSLVAAVAVDAIGKENVVGVSMPSRYSSEGSIKDAQEFSQRQGIKLMIIPIEPAHSAYLEMLEPVFAGTEPGASEENIQARIRGNIVMALSNKFGWLVLTTGNKSEMATGYATLYGDMAGGFAVIKDVPKTLVYRLARYRNTWREGPVIPETVIEKPPSAELKPGQFDQDSLPPYEELDAVLEAYVEDDKSVEEIAAMGHDRDLVVRVIQMVNRNEYKRRQSPPGVKITPRAFGRDRRLPIANRYKGF